MLPVGQLNVSCCGVEIICRTELKNKHKYILRYAHIHVGYDSILRCRALGCEGGDDMAAEAEALLDLRRGSSQAAHAPDPPRCQNGRPCLAALSRSPFLSASFLND